MENDTNNRSKSHVDSFGNLLQSRVEGLKTTGVRTALVCGECGSPLSENSKFCWMCGATTDESGNSHTRKKVTGPALSIVNGAASPPAVDVKAPEYEAPSTAASPLQSELLDAPQAAEPAQGSSPEPAVQTSEEPVRPSENTELFSQFYVKRPAGSETETDEDDDTRPSRFDYRLVAVPLLLAFVIILGNSQRQNAKALYVTLRDMVRAEIASLWPGSEQPESVAELTSPTQSVSRVHVKKLVTTSRARKGEVESKTTYHETEKPLRIKVEGQPGPEVMTAAANASIPILTPAKQIGVGIRESAVTVVPPSPMKVEISPRESLSLLLKQVPPIYPVAARAAMIQGAVVLKALIRRDGNVGDLKPVSGNPLLVPAAMDAVRQWVYRPYYRDGEPTEVETLVVVEFSLTSERADAASRPSGK